MKRGEVWWIDFDPSIGGEIQKMRPAVIVSNDAANAHLNRIQVVPLTSNIERVFPGETLVRIGNQTRKALATQIMTAAKERLGRRLGVLRPVDLRAVETPILVQLGIGPPNQRKSLCCSDFGPIRGAPRCRQSVAQNCLILEPLKAALWKRHLMPAW